MSGNVYDEKVSSLSNWMQKVHTAKDIACWIIQRLTEWRTSEPFSPAQQSDMPGLLQAISAQDRIGWLVFFEGCIAIEWAGVQEAHFLWLGRWNTGKRWATSLIVKLWEVAWDLWDHRNQVKKPLETAQDVARWEFLIHAISSENAFGRNGLPQRDWRLSNRPLLSTLASSLHYLESWLLRVQTARLHYKMDRHRTATGLCLFGLRSESVTQFGCAVCVSAGLCQTHVTRPRTVSLGVTSPILIANDRS
jgi:hypothetical protein